MKESDIKTASQVDQTHESTTHQNVLAPKLAGETIFTDSRSEVTAQLQRIQIMRASPQALQQKARMSLIANSQNTLQQKSTIDRITGQSSALVQREEDPLQSQSESTTLIQREAQEIAKPNNTGLPDQLKSGIESLSGMSMDHVKVHYNSSQPAQLNALAYAQGSDIHIGAGQEQHLPHEAWHVVQQAQGRVKPTMQMKEGVPVNDDAGLEHEADVMGAKALQTKLQGSAAGLKPYPNTNNQFRAPAQRKLLLDSDDSKFLTPEYLEGELKIVPPQLYKTLFYALDDAEPNFAVKSSTPGNFDPATKTITIPGNGLEFTIPRLKGIEKPLGGEKERFVTAIAQLSHEMQHAFDYVLGGKKEGLDNTSGTEAKYLAVMDTELRAWATEAIAYKKHEPNIDKGGVDLLRSWRDFNPEHINHADEVLKPNLIWARILQYSVKNKIEGLEWRACARTGNVLTRAVEERRRVLDFVDIQAAPESEVTIDTLDDLNTNYGDLKAGGNRVKKIKLDSDYKFYLFRRRVYKVKKSVAVEADCFDLATGSFGAPVVVADEPVEEVEAEVLQLDKLADINTKAPELKAATAKLSKVKKDGEYRVYALEGKQYKVHESLLASTYFDLATGSFGAPVEVADEPVEEVAPDVLQLDKLADINTKAPELKAAAAKLSKVKKDGEYRVYALEGKQYKVHESLLASTYFDLATGAWQ